MLINQQKYLINIKTSRRYWWCFFLIPSFLINIGSIAIIDGNGFIAADGSIGRGYNRRQLSIAISWRDVRHLQKFRDLICPDKPIRRYFKGEQSTAKLVINSPVVISDLDTIYNITSGKSLTLLPPNITDRELILSYIVGYIDGDGNIRPQRGGIRITATLQMAEWVKEIIDRYSPKVVPAIPVQDKRCAKRGTHNVYSYSFGMGRAMGLTDCIQKYNLPVLERKWCTLNAKWECAYPFITHCRHSILANAIGEWT